MLMTEIKRFTVTSKVHDVNDDDDDAADDHDDEDDDDDDDDEKDHADADDPDDAFDCQNAEIDDIVVDSHVHLHSDVAVALVACDVAVSGPPLVPLLVAWRPFPIVGLAPGPCHAKSHWSLAPPRSACLHDLLQATESKPTSH